jgi:hypothetical protein
MVTAALRDPERGDTAMCGREIEKVDGQLWGDAL